MSYRKWTSHHAIYKGIKVWFHKKKDQNNLFN